MTDTKKLPFDSNLIMIIKKASPIKGKPFLFKLFT